MIAVATVTAAGAKKFKWSSINVPEEGGISFVQITRDGSNVCGPQFSMAGWYTGRGLSVSPDGSKITYIGYKNKTRNVYVTGTGAAGSSVQRTFRAKVNTACFSYDGKELLFSEVRDNTDLVNITSAEGGNIINQVSTGGAPSFNADGTKVFFSRFESGSGSSGFGRIMGKVSKKMLTVDTYSVWSYDRTTNQLTNYANGNNPQPLRDRNAFICERTSEYGYGEIWLVDLDNGTESLILSEPGKNFTTPSVSPDGQWIVVMANSSSNAKNVAAGNKKTKVFSYSDKKQNTDIFVVKMDGTQLTQLTYHKGNDCQPAWSPDGKYIYFVSQRGSQTGDYNVWRMDFTLR